MPCRMCSNIHFRRVSELGLSNQAVKAWSSTMESHKKAWYIHHESPATLKASAGNGCVFCFMLWLSLFELVDDHLDTMDAVGADPVFLWIWWPEDEIQRAGPENFSREPINAVCGARAVWGLVELEYPSASLTWSISVRLEVVLTDIQGASRGF